MTIENSLNIQQAEKIGTLSRSEKRERLQEDYNQQISHIDAVITRGTKFIKKGHGVKHLNPEGKFAEIPLSKKQRERMFEEKNHLLFKLTTFH